jgi:hypothetical protein
MRRITTFLAFVLAASSPLAAADAHAGHDHAGHSHGPTAAIGTVKRPGSRSETGRITCLTPNAGTWRLLILNCGAGLPFCRPRREYRQPRSPKNQNLARKTKTHT